MGYVEKKETGEKNEEKELEHSLFTKNIKPMSETLFK